MEEEQKRLTPREEGEKRDLANRINRIAGQLNGVKRMIEEDRYCEEILIQLSAIDQAVRSLSASVMESHLRCCIVKKIQAGDLEAVSEIADLYRRYQK